MGLFDSNTFHVAAAAKVRLSAVVLSPTDGRVVATLHVRQAVLEQAPPPDAEATPGRTPRLTSFDVDDDDDDGGAACFVALRRGRAVAEVRPELKFSAAAGSIPLFPLPYNDTEAK